MAIRLRPSTLTTPERRALFHGCTRPGHERSQCPMCSPPLDLWTAIEAEALAYGQQTRAERQRINDDIRAEVAAGTYRHSLGTFVSTVQL